jgi:hypothetical protein
MMGVGISTGRRGSELVSPDIWQPGDMRGALRRPWFSRALLSLKEAGLHLVDLDESGNTGTNLNDTEQPIFLLAALIVPEAAWQPLERDLAGAGNHAAHPHDGDAHEIYAVDLRSGRGAFAGSPVGARIAELSGEWVGVVARGGDKGPRGR